MSNHFSQWPFVIIFWQFPVSFSLPSGGARSTGLPWFRSGGLRRQVCWSTTGVAETRAFWNRTCRRHVVFFFVAFARETLIDNWIYSFYRQFFLKIRNGTGLRGLFRRCWAAKESHPLLFQKKSINAEWSHKICKQKNQVVVALACKYTPDEMWLGNLDL